MPRSTPSSRTPARPQDSAVLGSSLADTHLTPYARADYIHDLTDELRQMADAAGFDLLAYILDMAHIEAGHMLRRSAPASALQATAAASDEEP